MVHGGRSDAETFCRALRRTQAGRAEAAGQGAARQTQAGRLRHAARPARSLAPGEREHDIPQRARAGRPRAPRPSAARDAEEDAGPEPAPAELADDADQPGRSADAGGAGLAADSTNRLSRRDSKRRNKGSAPYGTA